MPNHQLIYLQGFASSPASRKASWYRDWYRADGIDLLVPDLIGGKLYDLTVSSQLEIIRQTIAGRSSALIGSSLGGYLAALAAARWPEFVDRLVLMAPAFGFARLWADSLGAEQMELWQRSGSLPIHNYASGEPARVSWELMEDARRYEEEPKFAQPALIFHGTRDTVVPVEASRAFAASRPNVRLREVGSGHELLDVARPIFEEMRDFLNE